jgi:hypothetical protein
LRAKSNSCVTGELQVKVEVNLMVICRNDGLGTFKTEVMMVSLVLWHSLRVYLRGSHGDEYFCHSIEVGFAHDL